MLFFVLGEVTPSWSSLTRNCFLSCSLSGFLFPGVIGVVPADELEDDKESRSPMVATVVTERPTEGLAKVE